MLKLKVRGRHATAGQAITGTNEGEGLVDISHVTAHQLAAAGATEAFSAVVMELNLLGLETLEQ